VSTPLLLARNIVKSYATLPVLRGIDLELYPGEVMALVGSSGAGKTTLLQILGTLDKPDQGEVFFQEKSLFQKNSRQLASFRNQHLGFVFQFHYLIAEFTAEENVFIPALIAGQSKKAAQQRAQELLEYMGLSERAHHRPSELSGGEQQRVAVARALMNRPQLILADEPTGNLDSVNGERLFSLFLQLAAEQHVSFLIATHNETFAQAAHRRVLIRDGQFVR